MKQLVEFKRVGAKPVLIAPEHVVMVEPQLEGGWSKIWLVGASWPVVVEHSLVDTWSMLWHADALAKGKV